MNDSIIHFFNKYDFYSAFFFVLPQSVIISLCQTGEHSMDFRNYAEKDQAAGMI